MDKRQREKSCGDSDLTLRTSNDQEFGGVSAFTKIKHVLLPSIAALALKGVALGVVISEIETRSLIFGPSRGRYISTHVGPEIRVGPGGSAPSVLRYNL